MVLVESLINIFPFFLGEAWSLNELVLMWPIHSQIFDFIQSVSFVCNFGSDLSSPHVWGSISPSASLEIPVKQSSVMSSSVFLRVWRSISASLIIAPHVWQSIYHSASLGISVKQSSLMSFRMVDPFLLR